MLESLLNRQNRDGGWPYAAGPSWTEPTVYAALAAWAAGERVAAGRAAEWLGRTQRSDGGFAPQAAVEESTWVTALAAVLPPDLLSGERRRRAVAWLLRITGKETTPAHRLRQFLLGNPRPPDQEFHGWPWFPGAAAWVGPTSLALLALRAAASVTPSREIDARIAEGRGFLLARMCREGGWNHGSVQALGYSGRPYPETTGTALLGLAGVRSPEIDRALDAGASFLDGCRSVDGLNWLRLGLAAHGRLPAAYCPPQLAYRTIRDRSLVLLADSAAAGRNPFLP